MYIKNGIAYAGTPSADLSVDAVRVLGDGILIVTFSTGEDRLFDVTTLLRFPAFKSLANQEMQNSAKVNHGVLTWDDGRLDYATESLYAESHPYQRLAVC